MKHLVVIAIGICSMARAANGPAPSILIPVYFYYIHSPCICSELMPHLIDLSRLQTQNLQALTILSILHREEIKSLHKKVDSLTSKSRFFWPAIIGGSMFGSIFAKFAYGFLKKSLVFVKN